MNNHKAIAFFSGFPDRRFTDEIAERLEKLAAGFFGWTQPGCFDMIYHR